MKPGMKKLISCTAAFFVGLVLTVAYYNLFPKNDVIDTEEQLSHAARFARVGVGKNRDAAQRKESLHKVQDTKGDKRKLLNFSWLTDALGLGDGDGSSGSGGSASDSSNNTRVGGDGDDANTSNQPQPAGRSGGNASGGTSGNVVVEESIAESMTRMQMKFRSPPSSSSQRSSNVTTVDVNPYPCAIPQIRYVPWNKLTQDTQQIVSLLGYDHSSWDYTTHALLEDAPFSAFSESQKKAALFIGIDECVWDCFFNHYKAYSTEMLAQLGLDGHVPTMLEMQSKYWKDMSDAERETAAKFCYFEQLWNEEPLGTWSR